MISLVSIFIILCALVIGLMTFIRWLESQSGAHDEVASEALTTRINALLPQTQCGQCGHPGCRPYAEEISLGGAINKCPPGGKETIRDLAKLLNRPVVPLDPIHGREKSRKIAFIREAECIGCTKCIQACPVDAILGATKRMHTVIETECTGCDLCVEPCPVDCIDMLNIPQQQSDWHWPLPGSPTRTVWPEKEPS